MSLSITKDYIEYIFSLKIDFFLKSPIYSTFNTYFYTITMSKIYLIGDSHIGLGYPNSVDKWYKVHQQYFTEFLIPTLKKRIQPDR